jgi:hypothetical protein
MMRNPACSIMALIAPVRLRAVASGLMIEKVRSTVMGLFFEKGYGESRQRRLIAAVPARGKARDPRGVAAQAGTRE